MLLYRNTACWFILIIAKNWGGGLSRFLLDAHPCATVYVDIAIYELLGLNQFSRYIECNFVTNMRNGGIHPEF